MRLRQKSGPLKGNPEASMGKSLGLEKSGPRREVVRLLRWSGTNVIL